MASVLGASALIATLVVLPAASIAANNTARSTLVAGGATLPALGYMGATFGTGKLSTGAAAKSVFGFALGSSPTIQYCQTGSGYGKKVLDGAANVTNPPTSTSQEAVNLTCTNGTPVVGVNGFQAPQTGTGFPITDPDVVASDAALLISGTTDEYDIFLTNKVNSTRGSFQPDRGEPVQLPEIVGSVGMMYNDPDLTTQPNLTPAQICSVVKGTVTQWHQLGIGPANGRLINFVYRADGSGTTFSFSNFLVNNVLTKCGVNVSQQFTGGSSTNVVTTPPPLSAGASGNSNMTTCIASGTNCASGIGGSGTENGHLYGSMGYVETANILGSPLLNVAKGIFYTKVNNKDPKLNLPEAAASVASTQITFDKEVVTNGGAATLQSPGMPIPVAKCLLIVNPSGYGNVTTGYPILAVSNLDFAYSDNGTNNANLQKVARALVNPNTVFANGFKIGATTGGGTPQITTVDASTTVTGKGTTGYSTLSASFADTTSGTKGPISTAAVACINT
ncbi:MAG: substrate-binding domain-containing protein [Candidatus Eremiobacteraeota bacterium]|nr:substrate-binding domain-containing protein [Candidatus Eremiobacteraeota bacterium]